MKFYFGLFSFLFHLPEKLGTSIVDDNDERKAISTITFISLFPIVNLNCLRPALGGVTVVWVSFLVLLLNGALFWRGNRYKKIIYNKAYEENWIQILSAAYVLLSVIFFIYCNSSIL